MMKRRYYIFALMIMMLFCGEVNAFTCGYYIEKEFWNLHIDYEVEDDTITFYDKRHSGGYIIDTVMDFYVGEEYKGKTNQEQIKILAKFLDNKCQKKVYVCQGENRDVYDYTEPTYAILFDNQYELEARQYNGKMYSYDFGDNLDEADVMNTIEFGGGNNCFEVPIYEKSVVDADIVEVIGQNCDYVDKYLNGKGSVSPLEEYYKECNTNHNIESCHTYDENRNLLKSYCYSTIEYTNFNNPCVHICANDVPIAIGKIEGSFGDNDCHISNKIINFIANILKWGKYFAPVLVIILSIFDFIKAIAAQNDEDMKKSQTRFAKRLIAAALLFIVPFLIYFVLDKFNLINNDPYCGLFK